MLAVVAHRPDVLDRHPGGDQNRLSVGRAERREQAQRLGQVETQPCRRDDCIDLSRGAEIALVDPCAGDALECRPERVEAIGVELDPGSRTMAAEPAQKVGASRLSAP